MIEDYDHIQRIANEDVSTLKRKGMKYGGSWRQRGGIGAFMMLARKWDRIENQAKEHGFDVFRGIEIQQRNECADGLLEDIRDLRAYLLLVESHLTDGKTGSGSAVTSSATACGSLESLGEKVTPRPPEQFDDDIPF